MAQLGPRVPPTPAEGGDLMPCYCSCHSLALDNPYVCDHCSDAHLINALQPSYEVTAENLEAFVTELKMYDGDLDAYNLVRLEFRSIPPDYALDGCVVGVTLTKQLWSDSYFNAMDEARRLAAKEFNKYFAKSGVPTWVQIQLDHWHDTKAAGKTWINPALPKESASGTYTSITANSHGSSLATWYEHSPAAAPYVGGRQVVGDLQRHVPDLMAWVRCPEPQNYWSSGMHCDRNFRVVDIVQHLNDHHRWDRNKIADWLESLDLDLSFRAEPLEEVKEPPPPLPADKKADPHYTAVMLEKLKEEMLAAKAAAFKHEHWQSIQKTWHDPHGTQYTLSAQVKFAKPVDDFADEVDTHPLAKKAKAAVNPLPWQQYLFNPTKNKPTKKEK